MPSVVMVTPLVIVIFVFLPIFLMGALGLVLTVASRKTRPAGIGLLAVASLAVVGMVGLGVLWAGVSSPRDVPSETMSARKIITVEGRASESARGRTYAPAPPMSRSSSRTRGGFELVPEPDANDPVYGPQAGDTSPSPPPNRESASHDHPRASNTISGLRRAVARGFVETWHPGDGRKRVEATSKSSSGDGSVGSKASETVVMDEESSPSSADSAAPVTNTSRHARVVSFDRNKFSHPGTERPAWLDGPTPPRVEGVDLLPVSSGRWATRSECRRALDDEMKQEVDQYVNDHLGKADAAQLVDFDKRYIKTHLLTSNIYEEIVEHSFGPMREQHALLEFSPSFRDQIDHRYRETLVSRRLLHTSFGLVGVLAVLGIVYSYFRVDTATRGFYTARLQLAAATAILTLVAAGVLVARWLPWI